MFTCREEGNGEFWEIFCVALLQNCYTAVSGLNNIKKDERFSKRRQQNKIAFDWLNQGQVRTGHITSHFNHKAQLLVCIRGCLRPGPRYAHASLLFFQFKPVLQMLLGDIGSFKTNISRELDKIGGVRQLCGSVNQNYFVWEENDHIHDYLKK